MKENEQTFDIVASFIKNELGVSKKKMSLDTKLEKDLKVSGDDGWEFLENFIIHFNIKYDKNKEFPKYFEDDGLILFFDWRSLFNKRKKKYQQSTDLTVAHLVKVLELGYWIYE